MEQTFNSTAELMILVGITTKKTKAEIETHPVIAKFKIKKCSI